jgi:hypothetical protein
MGAGVIRFRCPTCARQYEVLEALAGFPLICKGCRSPMTVPTAAACSSPNEASSPSSSAELPPGFEPNHSPSSRGGRSRDLGATGGQADHSEKTC